MDTKSIISILKFTAIYKTNIKSKKKENDKYNLRQGDCRKTKHMVNVMNVYILVYHPYSSWIK